MTTMLTKRSSEYDGRLRLLFCVECKSCKKDRWIPKTRIRKQNFCNRRCQGTYQKLTTARKTVQCNTCGKAIKRLVSSFSKSKHGFAFCNRRCKETAQSIDGGLVKIQPPHYNSATGRASYRQRAFRRKPKRCEKCGYNQDPQMLDVHHLDEDRGNNALDNLQILCVWCHAILTRRAEWHEWSAGNGLLVQRENTGFANQE